MIRVVITDEDGTLISAIVLNMTDTNPKTGKLDPQWVGQQVIDELPSDREALAKLLS